MQHENIVIADICVESCEKLAKSKILAKNTEESQASRFSIGENARGSAYWLLGGKSRGYDSCGKLVVSAMEVHWIMVKQGEG